MVTLLTSPRLLLRRIEPSDLPSLIRIFSDPEMMHYLGAPWTPEYVAEVGAEWQSDWGIEQRWTGALIHRETGGIIGAAGLTRDTLEGEPGYELSWFILPEHQKRGYAAEITAALLRFAFHVHNAGRVVAATHPANPAAKRVLEKLGFTYHGERHETYDDLPGFDTQAFWALERESWLESRSPSGRSQGV